MLRRLRCRVSYGRLVDLLSGLLFLALGIAGIVLSGNYRLGTPGNMGPGYFPLMVSICLAAIGLLVTLNVGAGEAPERREIALRGPFVVLASIVVFALTLDRLGLVVASFLLPNPRGGWSTARLGCGRRATCRAPSSTPWKPSTAPSPQRWR